MGVMDSSIGVLASECENIQKIEETYCGETSVSDNKKQSIDKQYHVASRVAAVLKYKFGYTLEEAFIKVINSNTFKETMEIDENTKFPPLDDMMTLYANELGAEGIETSDYSLEDYQYVAFTIMIMVEMVLNDLVSLDGAIKLCTENNVLKYVMCYIDDIIYKFVLRRLTMINEMLNLGLKIPEFDDREYDLELWERGMPEYEDMEFDENWRPINKDDE